jgi:hypothetical protein
MKLRNLIAVGAIAVSSLATPVLANPAVGQFPDVQPTDWAYQAILTLRDRYGVVAGYPDGTFRAGKVATRSELAALVNASLDQITSYVDAKDAALAAALRAEVSGVSNRVTKLEVAAARKNLGVGSYLGAGVLLNRQGVAGNGYTSNRTVAGATIQGRLPVATLWGNEVSVRPYVNLVSSPAGNLGAGGGALATYDYSLSRKTLADGSRVSTANLYGGVGYQIPFVNGTLSNYQAAVGNRGQAVFVVGGEARLTNSLVGFTDIKFPTTNSAALYGNTRAYSPVYTLGLGFKF